MDWVFSETFRKRNKTLVHRNLEYEKSYYGNIFIYICMDLKSMQKKYISDLIKELEKQKYQTLDNHTHNVYNIIGYKMTVKEIEKY